MTARGRRILFGSVFVALALGLLFALAQLRLANGEPLVPRAVIVIAAVITGVAGFAAARVGDAKPSERVVRWTGGPAPPAYPGLAPPGPLASPYRGAPPKAWLPRTSARRTALVMSACLAFTGAAVPVALHLPRWVEMEAVLAGWWLIWAVLLTVVARRGAELVDDHELVIRLPWSPASSSRSRAARARAPAQARTWWSKILDLLSFPSDLEALVLVVGLAIVLGVALAGAWLVIEVVAPVLFTFAYVGVVRALRRAAEYRGSTVRASLVGAGWATAYVGPIALLVWLVHRVVAG